MSSGGGGGGSSTQTQKLDPWLKDRISENLENVRGLDPIQPIPASDAIAGLTPQMQQQLSQQQQLGQQGIGLLGQGNAARSSWVRPSADLHAGPGDA